MNLALIRMVGNRHRCDGFGMTGRVASGEWREKQIPHCVRDDRKQEVGRAVGFGGRSIDR